MTAATTRVEAVRDGGPATEMPAGPRRTLRGRVSRGHVVMVVAGVVGVVLSFAALREHEGNARVLVAAHEIRAGETVGPADFRSPPRCAPTTRPRCAGRWRRPPSPRVSWWSGERCDPEPPVTACGL
jgi:hypothetical protein